MLIADLKKHYPYAHCALEYQTPFQLLVATVLSAQCTDERVNQVTRVLFAEYPDADKLATADLAEIESIVRPTGFFKNKAKNIVASAKIISERYQGQVPRTLDELTALPGVGRKTANVVLGNAFEIASGVVVDTHVMRLSNRLGLVQSEDPVKIEQDLCRMVDQKNWIQFSHWLIWHGRSLCLARKPKCQECFLFDRCPRVGV